VSVVERQVAMGERVRTGSDPLLKRGAGDTAPCILFGAHDRHNFGDLLFGRVAQALLEDRAVEPAGLVSRDMSPYGGFRITSIDELARRWRDAPVEIIHIGGEILSTTAWQAAVMLAEPAEAQALIGRYDADPAAGCAYASGLFGFSAQAPYLVGRELFPQARRIVCNAVGGADLAAMEEAFRDEVLRKLAGVDVLFVREHSTQAALRAAGIEAGLAPDPAVLTVQLFGGEIAAEMVRGEVARCRQAFPQGFLAVQFSAACGDDATLTRIARQLDEIAALHEHGIVLLRAGAAPWHDDLDVYRRCAALMRRPVRLFASLELWQIVALIAASEGFLGTSLHGRIVACAYAKPRVSFLPSSLQGRANKLVAYTATWEMPQMPGVVSIDRLAEAFEQALRVPRGMQKAHAETLAARYREAAGKIFMR